MSARRRHGHGHRHLPLPNPKARSTPTPDPHLPLISHSPLPTPLLPIPTRRRPLPKPLQFRNNKTSEPSPSSSTHVSTSTLSFPFPTRSVIKVSINGRRWQIGQRSLDRGIIEQSRTIVHPIVKRGMIRVSQGRCGPIIMTRSGITIRIPIETMGSEIIIEEGGPDAGLAIGFPGTKPNLWEKDERLRLERIHRDP
jgi:hypothetical protein